MEENKENQLEKIAQLEDAIKKLPIKLQHAIYWAIENYGALEEMGKNSQMTLEEIRKAKTDALTEEHYALLLLLCITELIKESKENEEL